MPTALAMDHFVLEPFGRGDHTVGNPPHRAQISQSEFFELNPRIEIRQTVPHRAIRDSSISVNGTLPPLTSAPRIAISITIIIVIFGFSIVIIIIIIIIIIRISPICIIIIIIIIITIITITTMCYAPARPGG